MCITQKGIDEVKSRAYKVGMKKRSVLICLEKPHTIESLVSKSVFPPAEIIAEIQALAQDVALALPIVMAQTGGKVRTFLDATGPCRVYWPPLPRRASFQSAA